MNPRSKNVPTRERGTSLVEMLIALVVLAVGVLAVGRVFPGTSRRQVQDRLSTSASYYAQEKLEQLLTLNWNDANVTVGRHPAGTATESLGSGKWQRYYNVTAMASPLDQLKKVTVYVYWTTQNMETVTVVNYKRR